MKKITLSLFALSIAATPLMAETPMEMAQRVDACDGAEILSATVDADGELEVTCATAVAGNGGGLGGGLATPALALGVLGLAVGAFSGGSSSSDTQ
ncbi:hypothetical protein [Salibaculum sp.]|uniref:hypothetical protein n=1 Tax=Salibaculum sp. TaxID=2855480 RepID=UPI002B467B92|nr:hypothetical protein [Salibaculum sp.]HKL70950.1 hypothetical protein [Salibaculum sp.]